MKEIFERRSIRKYENKAVSDDLINQILKSAMASPSAGNQMPWEFIVLKDKETMKNIANIHPYGGMLNDCPVAIVVCGNLEIEKHEGFWIQDCSASTQNILLSATHLGLGSVWVGVYPIMDRVKNIQAILNLPKL